MVAVARGREGSLYSMGPFGVCFRFVMLLCLDKIGFVFLYNMSKHTVFRPIYFFEESSKV